MKYCETVVLYLVLQYYWCQVLWDSWYLCCNGVLSYDEHFAVVLRMLVMQAHL